MQINVSQAKMLKYRLYYFRQCKSTYLRLKRSNIDSIPLGNANKLISGENAQISTLFLSAMQINLSQAKTLKYRLYSFRQRKSTYLRLKRSNIDSIPLGNVNQRISAKTLKYRLYCFRQCKSTHLRLKRSNIDSIPLGNVNQRISG